MPDFGLTTGLTEDDYVPVEFVWRTGQMTTISLFCQYGGYTSMPTSINTKLSAEWFGDIIVQ